MKDLGITIPDHRGVCGDPRQQMTTMSKEQAKEQGYYPLTTPYNKDEEWMLDNILKDMEGVDHVLVNVAGGVEVWRK